MERASPAAASIEPLTLHVHLLGRFAVGVGGTELPAVRWPGLRAAQLVQLLALQPGRRLTRDQVIDALWPRLDAVAGGANLRKALHHARQALGRPDAVVLQGGELVLWPGRPILIDVEGFERAAAAALARRDPAACAEAAAAYPGELLPGSRYEPWTANSRERLSARVLELLRGAGQWEQLAEREPSDEPAHRLLMRRELDAGNRAAALRWYAHLREGLQKALGIVPDAETERLYHSCIDGLQPAVPPLVGRAMPLAQAAAWLTRRDAARPGGMVLRGTAGIGKTALAHEIVARAQSRGLARARHRVGGPRSPLPGRERDCRAVGPRRPWSAGSRGRCRTQCAGVADSAAHPGGAAAWAAEPAPGRGRDSAPAARIRGRSTFARACGRCAPGRRGRQRRTAAAGGRPGPAQPAAMHAAGGGH